MWVTGRVARKGDFKGDNSVVHLGASDFSQLSQRCKFRLCDSDYCRLALTSISQTPIYPSSFAPVTQSVLCSAIGDKVFFNNVLRSTLSLGCKLLKGRSIQLCTWQVLNKCTQIEVTEPISGGTEAPGRHIFQPAHRG